MTQSYLIRARDTGQMPSLPTSADVKLTPKARVYPGSSREAGAGDVNVEGDDLVRIEHDNGFVLWSRADDLIAQQGEEFRNRDGAAAWQINPRYNPVRGGSNERGKLGLLIKVLDFFGVDLVAGAAAKTAAALENWVLGKDTPPGVFRCSLDSQFALSEVRGEIAPSEQPILVLLHGTGSSTEGSFGELWQAPQSGALERLRQQYRGQDGDRFYALQHRSLTASPIENALDLVRKLPASARLHLVSHSRGGMVGELLCLAQRHRDNDPLTTEHIHLLFKADRTMASQLGLGSLDQQELKERDQAYDEDRQRLLTLCQLLDEKQITVERFVRVACPARGTTLASGRLDRWLSVLNHFMFGNAVVQEALDFILAVVKERTDPRTLPGLEAMMPGSALTRLFNDPRLTTVADLSAIAGDVEGDNFFSKLKFLLTDWFYGSDHDLVVNTGSMFGGISRSDEHGRFRRDQGPKVNHFNYFQNEESVRWLLQGLTRADGNDGGFLPLSSARHEEPRRRDAATGEALDKPAWKDAVQKSRSSNTPRPLAVVLPGTMGSELQVSGSSVWLNYFKLAGGAIKRLRMDARDVESVDVLDAFYGPLLQALARRHWVEICPYDWRNSIVEAAEKLADQLEQWLPQAERNQQPVYLVAHSMGGLVARAMIAEPRRGRQLWQRICQLPGSKLLMLGTPNGGSHEAMRWLTGHNPTQSKLALLDLTSNSDDIVNLVRTFPGLLELLPFRDAEPDFASQAFWKDLKQQLKADWRSARQADLKIAQGGWKRLADSPIDSDRMIYVAGCQPQTVVDYRLVEGRKSASKGLEIEYLGTPEGDGTVSWRSGSLPGVSTWYAQDTGHDELCNTAKHLPAYMDLLATGKTTRLRQQPPSQASRGEAATALFPISNLPPTDDIPDQWSTERLGFGPNRFKREESLVTPTIRISLRHGDLAYARYPVMVGHYRGDSLVGAEGALDKRLGGCLRRRMALGLYPGEIGSSAVFVNEEAAAKPAGGVVVGLGQLGELTPGQLEQGLSEAMLSYAMHVAAWPDQRYGSNRGVRSASLTCLLVGSGNGGISSRDSIEVILKSAVAANQRLWTTGMAEQVLIDQIEFLELYQDVAITVAAALHDFIATDRVDDAVIWEQQEIIEGEGRRSRATVEEPEGWWHRLEIVEDEHRRGLRYAIDDERAGMELVQSSGQLKLADDFIQRACQCVSSDSEVAKTLFEMLLPNRLKEISPDMRDRVLILDPVSARYPWELLEDRWSRNGEPLAVGAGMVRQLKITAARTNPQSSPENRAFVVGNPDLERWEAFADLPGARQEALAVSRRLRQHAFDVTESIDQGAQQILEGLHGDRYRILHLAGHGVHEFDIPDSGDWDLWSSGNDSRLVSAPQQTQSGMVIGRETLLTPADVQQMRWTPDIVFINCCHLGNTSGEQVRAYNRLAANLGVQFINQGVRAVIAAGWAVDDRAAVVFAERFYECMLAGGSFGEAVKAAREDTWRSCPEVNSWGAYQCYGDPAFRLHDMQAASLVARSKHYHSPIEVKIALDNLRESIRVETNDISAESHEQLIENFSIRISRIEQDLRDQGRERWMERADLAAAFGFAWGELGQWPEGVNWFDKALGANVGECPLQVVEQKVNYGVRHIAREWLRQQSLAKGGSGGEASLEQLRAHYLQQIRSTIDQLQDLAKNAPTRDRLSIMGSAHKRLAMILEDSDRPALASAISESARHYQQALKITGPEDCYTFCNAVLLEILEQELKNKDVSAVRAQREQECEQEGQRERLRNQQDPNFWHAVGEADYKTLLLLLRRETSTESERQQSCEDIIRLYKLAAARGVSPRSFYSVLDQIDFIIGQYQLLARHSRGDNRSSYRETAQALQNIRAAISFQ